MNRQIKKYYWIKVSGMINEFLPIYYNNGKWRISIQDSTKIVSENTLKLIFGKDCILREVDFKKDISLSPFDTSTIQAIHVISDNGIDSCLMYYPCLNCVEIHGQLTPFKIKDIKGYLIYKN
jgi:hypothetical protein